MDRDFRIGEWWARRQLSLLQQGAKRVQIEARSMDVLACLATKPGQVVTKEEILDEVWGEIHVSEGVIAHAISELRRAFGDTPRDARFIQTVHRRGYRLVAPVFLAQGEDEPRLGALVGKGFRLSERLGGGAMGVVYRAKDENLDRDVALKFLSPELSEDGSARKRFLREARFAAQLDHPHLATVHEIGETASGRLFIVTAYYGGGTLRQRLQEGALPTDEALRLARQLTSALAEAHRAGIVHRDLKPANILLSEDGDVRLGDFGIAKLQGATRLTRAGDSLGTPGYKAPEQSRGGEVDERADIWSLGVVLYEMLTGQPPFRGDNELAVLHSILHDDPPQLGQFGDFPEGLDELLRRTMAKEPDDRPQTADEVLAALEAIESGTPPALPDPPARPPPSPMPVRRRGRIAAAGLVAILLVVAVTWWMRLPRKPAEAQSPMVTHLIDQGRDYEEESYSPEDIQKAVDCYERALEEGPGDAYATAHLALALARLESMKPHAGRLERARGLADGVIESAPDLWLSHQALGKLQYMDEHYVAAEESARTALDLLPKNDPWADLPYILLGYSLALQGRDREALIELENSLEVGYGHIRGRLALAWYHFAKSELEDALRYYSQVLDIDTENFEALHHRGMIRLRMGANRDAISDFRRALVLRNEANTANNLGLALFNLARDGSNPEGYWRASIHAFELAIELEPDYATPHLGLGDVYRHGPEPDEDKARSEYEKALSLWQSLVKEGDSRWRINAQTALCTAKLGRFADAIEQIEDLLDGQEIEELMVYAARIYALAGESEKLFASMEAALAASDARDVFAAYPAFDAYQDNPTFVEIRDGAPVQVRDGR